VMSNPELYNRQSAAKHRVHLTVVLTADGSTTSGTRQYQHRQSPVEQQAATNQEPSTTKAPRELQKNGPRPRDWPSDASSALSAPAVL
jgi:hypothetical protein